MNRYVAQGLAIDLLNRKRLLFVGRSTVATAEAFNRVAEAVHQLSPELGTGMRLYRTYGNQRIVHKDGGAAYFHTQRQLGNGAARGLRFHVAFVEDPLLRDDARQRLLEALAPGADIIEFA